MARVIELGTFREKCPHCKSLIEFTIRDYVAWQKCDYTGSCDEYWGIQCPECLKYFEVESI